MHYYLGTGHIPDKNSGTAGMVQMYVSGDYIINIIRPDTDFFNPLQNHLCRSGRPGVYQCLLFFI